MPAESQNASLVPTRASFLSWQPAWDDETKVEVKIPRMKLILSQVGVSASIILHASMTRGKKDRFGHNTQSSHNAPKMKLRRYETKQSS